MSALGAAAIGLALTAFQARSKALAGAAIGLLGYKLSLFVPAIAVCLLAAEWTVVTGALAVAAVQVGIVAPIAGADIIRAFVGNTLAFAQSPDALSRSPYLMASWRPFRFDLLPPTGAWGAYAASAGATVAVAAWGWRRASRPLTRVAMLVVAIVLAAPHCHFYDLVILVPSFVHAAGVLVARRALAFRWCTWLCYFAPLAAPSAAATHVQPVTLLLAAWLVVLVNVAPPQPLRVRLSDRSQTLFCWTTDRTPISASLRRRSGHVACVGVTAESGKAVCRHIRLQRGPDNSRNRRAYSRGGLPEGA